MAKVILRQEAIDDLNANWDYTFEEWSEKQADKYYATLKSDCLEIGKNPKLGKEYDGNIKNLLGVRSGKHIIFIIKLTKMKLKLSEFYTNKWI